MVIHRSADIVRAAAELRFPVMVKGDIGGSGAGMARYDSLEDLAAFAEENGCPTGINGVTLVQEYVPARDGRVIRCDAGNFGYRIAVEFDPLPAAA